MAIEDYTTYTEYEETSDILTVTASSVTYTSISQDLDEECYVYKDFGVNHFGDFTKHEWQSKDISKTEYGTVYTYVQNNVIDVPDDTNDWFSQFSYWRVDEYRLYLRGMVGGVIFGQYWVGVFGTMYYYRMSRTGTTVTLKIYDDAARTSLKATLSDTCSNMNFRYMYGVSAYIYDTIEIRVITGWTEQLNLFETSVGSGIKFWDGTALVEIERDDNSPVKIWTNAGVIGLAIVGSDSPDATGISIWTGTAIERFKKFTG